MPYAERAGRVLFKLRVPVMLAAGLVAGAANAEAAGGSSGQDLGDVVEKVWKVIDARFTNGEQDCELLVHNTHDGTPTDTKITFIGEDVGKDEVSRACNNYSNGELVKINAHEIRPETATAPGKYAGISIKPYSLPPADWRPLAVLGAAYAGLLGLLLRERRR